MVETYFFLYESSVGCPGYSTDGVREQAQAEHRRYQVFQAAEQRRRTSRGVSRILLALRAVHARLHTSLKRLKRRHRDEEKPAA